MLDVLKRLRLRSPLAVIVALAGVGIYAVTSARPYDENAVTTAALNALSQQYNVAQAAGLSTAAALFRGNSLSVMSPMWDQVQRDIASGGDYPGTVEETNPKIEAIQGDATSVTLDLSVHERLANMRAGVGVDYSESDVVYHLRLDNVNGRWLVSDIDWRFAPGGGP